MKTLIILLFFLAAERAAAQFAPSLAVGMPLTHLNSHAQAGIAYRSTKWLFTSCDIRFNTHGYTAISVQPTIGYAHSWNNKQRHQLTTVPFIRYEIPAIVPGKQLHQGGMSYGIRHYLYNSFTELSYNKFGRVDITIGWSFKSIYR